MVGPGLRRRQLGRELRRLREAAGISREHAADYIGVKPPTVSRIELGRQGIRTANIRLLLQLYRVESPQSDAMIRMAGEANQRGWWLAYGDTVPETFKPYLSLEADTEEIWTYQSELVPGLLQTAEYARAISRAARPDWTDAELDRAVELRATRQRRLVEEPTLRLHAVLNEAVLHRQVGGAPTMRAQLGHLLDRAGQPNVTIQVLPFAVGAHPAMSGPFTLLRFNDEPSMNCVYLESDRGEVYQERPADIEHYSSVFERAANVAVSPERSTAIIKRLTRSSAKGGAG